jgi:hypothetical protein
MVPPAKALTQKKPICSATRHKAVRSTYINLQKEAAAARVHLTVTPQLAWAASSFVCNGLSIARSQASDQKV